MNLGEQFTRLLGDTSSDIYQHLPTFVEAAAMIENPRIIELGVRAGVSTIAWLYAIETAGEGHLWSVDGAPPCMDTDGTDLLGQYLINDRSKSSHWSWTFLKGWDNELWVQEALPEQVDIIFVDTNHTYEMTLDELVTYVPFVKAGGLMFFHDTNIETTGNASTPQPPFPVRTAIENYCAALGIRFSFVDNNCGLGTVYL